MPIAIDIGSKYTKLVRGEVNKKGNVVISDYFIEQTPEGAVENGYIRNSAELIPFLGDFVRKYNLGKSQCYISVKSSDIVSKEIFVPMLKGSKLKKVIQNEIDITFGSMTNSYIDYMISDTDVIDYKSIYKIMAYAVPKEIVLNYYEFISTINLKPMAFDVHRNAMFKLFRNEEVAINENKLKDRVIILADLGASYLDLDLIVDNRSIFKRSIAITDELTMEEDFNSGFANDYDSIPDNNEYSTYLSSEMGMNDTYYTDDFSYSPVSPFFTKVNEEVYKMMQFAVSREGGKPVSTIYLYGGNVRTQGLDQFLSSSLDVGVEKISSISNIELSPEADITDFIIASGSLIRL